MRKIYFLFIISMLSFPFASHSTCMDDAMSTSDINECTYKEYLVVDKKLNYSYQELLKIIPDNSKKKLREAQRAWLKYRDLECDFASEFLQGGTLATVVTKTCFVEMTKKRVLKLDSDIKTYKEL